MPKWTTEAKDSSDPNEQDGKIIQTEIQYQVWTVRGVV